MVYADVELISIDDLVLNRRGFLSQDRIRRLSTRALVDTGAYELVINESIKDQLGLPVLEQRIVRLADDTERLVEVAGPLEIRFENRRTVVNALVLPTTAEVLLGSIPMEGMDVLVDPRQQRLIVNPAYPEIPSTYVKAGLSI